MTEGNCGNTSLATPLLNSQYESPFFLIRAHHPGLQASYYSGASWLPGLFVCSCGWGCSVGRMHRVCGHWRHGEKGRGGHSSWILALNTKVLLLFSLFLLWFYGLLTGSRLSSGYERGFGRTATENLTGTLGGKGSQTRPLA